MQEMTTEDALRMRHASELEMLQTRLLRMLRSQNDNIADAIHAQANGSHKTALELMTRAQTAIQSEIDRLVDRA